MTISLITASAALQCVSEQLANEYSAGEHDAAFFAAQLIAKLIDSNILSADSTPTELGTLVFGDEFVAYKASGNWQAAYIQAIVSSLRAD